MKSNPTVNLWLDKRTTNKTNEHPIKIRITYERKYRLFSSNIFANENDFESIVSRNPRGQNREKKVYLDKIISKANGVIEKLPVFTFDLFKKEFYGISKYSNDVFDHFEIKINALLENHQIKTAINYRTTRNSLKAFKEKLKFQDITPEFLKKYDSHLANQGKKLTSRSIYSRAFRSIVNDAIKNGIQMEYPFGKNGFTPPSGQNVKKALTKEEVFKILDYKTDNEQEQWAVDLFNFSFTCNGMNLKDIAYLKYKNLTGNSLTFIRAKTKRTSKATKEILCSLDDDVFDIIQRNGNPEKTDNYIFPILSVNDNAFERERRIEQTTANVNKYLKRIAEKLGIEKRVTMYAARHSFASILNNSNTPVSEIKDMLGHTTLAVTLNYLDSITTEQVEVNRKKLKSR